MEVTSPDETRIHYEVYGNGPTVLLAHGSLMEGASWVEAGYMERLNAFRCVVLDCRGYGASDRPTDPSAYTTERYVEDLIAVADSLGAETFGVAGFSWGTAGGWAVAAAHPDRVTAFVAIGGWHPNLYSFDRDVMEKTRIEPMRQVGVDGFAEYMKTEEGPLPGWWERQVRACDAHAYIAQRYAAADWNRVSPTAASCPVLLVSGDKEDTARDSELIAGVLDRGEALIVDGKIGWGNFGAEGFQADTDALASVRHCTFNEYGQYALYSFRVKINDDARWFFTGENAEDNPPDNTWDLESAMAHEFGHATGRSEGGPGDDGHFGDGWDVCPDKYESNEAYRHTMCPTVQDGRKVMRSLEWHEISSFNQAYP